MIQNYIAKNVVAELSKKLHSKVTLRSIDYKMFNTIKINDLYVEDLQHDTLLFVHQADAHFQFWKIFKGKIIINSVELDQFCGNLVIDTAGHSNLDFVIKAFEKPKSNDTTTVTYQIQHFKLLNSRFSFTNKKLYKQLKTNVFNGNKLRLNHINAEIALNILNKDSLSASILKLSAMEQSGLVLSNLTAQIIGSQHGAKIPILDVKLPNSKIHLEDIQIKYDSLADLKHLVDKVRWKAPISSMNVMLSDLKAFVPEFKNMRGVATVKGLITGRISSLRFQKMEIKYGKSFLLNADLDINGLPNINESFIYGQINDLNFEKNDLQDFVSDLTNKPFLLPKEINQLGRIKYKGNMTGFLSNLVVYGNLNTDIGSVTTDILLKFENELKDLTYNGTIKSNNLQLGKLLVNNQLGKITFDINTKGTKLASKSLQGTIAAKVPELQFNAYTYRDIQFNGKYDGKGFDGKVDVKDDNINARFIGKIDLTKKLPVFDFNLKVANTNLNALHFTNKYPGAILSLNATTNMIGNSPDNINGYLRFDSISFTNQNKTLNVDEIKLSSRIEKNYTNFSIASDYINGTFSGNFKYSTIGLTFNQIVLNYLPALALKTSANGNYNNYIDVDIKIAKTKEITDVLEIPYTLEGVSTIKGYINENSNKIELKGNFPYVKSSKQELENLTFNIENANQKLQLASRAQLKEKDGLTNVFLLASANKDSVRTQFGWQNSQQITNAGEFLATTKLRNEDGKIAAKVSVLPTQIIISDSVWNIHPSSIDFNTDSTISIHNFRFDSQNQFIHINGIASKAQKDSLSLEMNEMNLEFILHLLKLRGIAIGGIVTGKATLFSVLKQPIFEAKLDVKDFKLNNKRVGNGKVFSNWDKVNSLLLAHGSFWNENNDTVVVAKAVYNPKSDTIDVNYKARNFSIEFLSPYLESVVQNLRGTVSGKVRMFGPVKKGIQFEGDVLLDKGQVSVNKLNTTYYLADSVHLTTESIIFKNMNIYDQERNPGKLNALLNHNGYFQHFTFNAVVKGKNLLGLNTKSTDNSYFFGKAYANGTVRIFGDEKEANIVVNAVSQPQTKCFIQMGGASTASDNSFINFVSKKNNAIKVEVAPSKPKSDYNVKVNLQVDVTPDADMELIVDPKGGDMITGKGSGNLRVQFDSFSDIKLFGTYTIDNGYYLFTLQNVIRKEFKINPGGTIAWTGSPFYAQVKISAIYPLTASLRDLMDKEQLASMTRTSLPVNCVLKLTDNLMKPTVNFDIELPASDEGVKQQVKNIINTDEMMNRQIVYLLLFNKFFTPDYLRTTTNNTYIGANEALGFATSTLSAQLNSWISQMSKTNNFTVGIDYRKTDQLSSDIQAQVLYQPNNRLIVNGNFGYRTDNVNTSTNANKFIGDLDIEWLLSESGKYRFKAYNHTIDRYQLRTAKTTQGAGFLYKENFNSVDELFHYYWQMLTGKGKKKTNEESSTTND
ncbi:MAG: translocation/assembly module TamB domain-containing protein [Paludibacter sp.]